MKPFALAVSACLLCMLGCSSQTGTHPDTDPQLVSEIEKIKAIDDHGHPLRMVADGEKPDEEYDALTFEEMEPFPTPLRIRPDNPEFIGAWRKLYGYRYNDMSEAHVRELLEAKQRMMREKGDGYPAWVLDQLGIEMLIANRIAMGRGLTPPHFRWASYVDALMLPLSSEGARKENPDYRSFYVGEDRLLKRYLAELQLNALPATLKEYTARVVTPVLERQKRDGALVVKFEAAYLRALDFGNPPEEVAARIYARYFKGGVPPKSEYKVLQDYLFRYISREAGRIGLVVHIHTCGGAGAYYQLGGTNPALLDSAFNDPSLRKTNFVMIHGGWPYEREAGFQLSKPNVYLDFSAMDFVLYPRELSRVLRYWIEYLPEKVLYGGDVEPFMPQINWEETAWLTITTGRKALAMALTGMMNDGEITREHAVEIARMVLHDNAAGLYKLK